MPENTAEEKFTPKGDIVFFLQFIGCAWQYGLALIISCLVEVN